MLGPRIATLRRMAGFTQSQLADRLGISPSAVGMYEQGRREPAGDLLIAMATLFGVSTDYLLTGAAGDNRQKVFAESVVESMVTQSCHRLRSRSGQTFTRQELTVLFAAFLLD